MSSEAPATTPAPSESVTTKANGISNAPSLAQEPQSNPSTATQSPQLKHEELTNSTRNTPVPQSLQFQTPANLKPSEIISGAPVRQWLNEKVTPMLIEGMRKLAKERPEDPLRVLGEYLIQQSESKS